MMGTSPQEEYMYGKSPSGEGMKNGGNVSTRRIHVWEVSLR
jgi:hypothetical protein